MNFDDVNDGEVVKGGLTDMDSLLDDDFKVPMRPSRTNKTQGDGVKVDLALSEELKTEVMAELAECSPQYALWLRVLMLRVLIRTPALGRLKGVAGYNLTQTCEFLGFENFEKFAEHRTLAEIRLDLGGVLARWEAQVGAQCRFPRVLQDNLSALADIIGLDALEQDILGLAVLVHAESAFESCCEILGGELAGYSIDRILAAMLGHKPEAVAKRLQRSEKLATSGLLTIDFSGRYTLRQLMDLLTVTFAVRMLVPQSDIRKIVEGFVRPMPASELTLDDYAHVKTNLEICRALLQKVLIYGKPGSGKTEFSRLVASELQLQLMEISPTNLSGSPVVPIRRVRSYRVAQSFFRSQPSIILFDECEEILNQSQQADHGDDEATVPRKSFINKILETNAVPTIWIANSICRFDEAYLRRFSLCFEMPLPSQVQRERMLTRVSVGVIGQQTQSALARNKDATPAMLVQTAAVIRAIAADKTEAERDGLAIHLINNALKAQSKTEVAMQGDLGIGGSGFEPQWVNCDVDLQDIGESLTHARAGRLCLWGPPGTGKTAFGKWLAQRLDMPHMVVKASELLSPYHGETEQNMARAFEAARQQRALLQFDEVDSFLQDRQKASRPWEVTQVNEMLTQMESFAGLFIASTNLFQNLDEASLRRFDMSIKFDYIKPEAAWAMFLKTCAMLGVDDAPSIDEQQVTGLGNLTPGDFDQVIRRSRLLCPSSALQVARSLQSAVALKKSGASRPIGFLRAA